MKPEKRIEKGALKRKLKKEELKIKKLPNLDAFCIY